MGQASNIEIAQITESIINVLILDSADTIEDDQQKSYIDLDYFIPDAPGVHIIITSRSSIAKEITTPKALKVTDMQPPKAIRLFQRSAKINEKGHDIATEVAQMVKELGFLALAITHPGRFIRIGDGSLVI